MDKNVFMPGTVRSISLAMQRAVQSPVCLMQSQAQIVDDAAPVRFVGHWDDFGTATLTNNGQSAVLQLNNRPYQPLVVGGPLGSIYVFEQLHFHWGPDDSVGCEHLIDGRARSMEAHLVHYNARYGSYAEALAQADGLMVAAFQFDAQPNQPDWMPLQTIVSALRYIQPPGTGTSVPSDCLHWLTGLVLDRSYYTYHGSMTTAPYRESVTWLVYHAPIFISSGQANAFRRLLRKRSGSAGSLTLNTSNFRPVQSPSNSFRLVFVRDTVPPLRSKL
ncbi:carbonic anhydrase 7-like [Anopheles maculipalpis]|uniref:carbonic anhydrase 7-like n=1 Tax=Anopheles maculipalpis TaxID=1496333 RepID=UPI002159AE35|nr:carbonic anhydrase 7-like [Anopheles maculipalpis]